MSSVQSEQDCLSDQTQLVGHDGQAQILQDESS